MVGMFGERSVKINEFKDFLSSKITELEKLVDEELKIPASELIESPEFKKQELAQLYLEYAFTSEGEEAIVYAHRAVAVNPDIEVLRDPLFLAESIPIYGENGTEGGHLEFRNAYLTERGPGHLKVLQSFLNGIKAEAKEKGARALEEHEGIYKLVQRKEIPDPHKYTRDISDFTDDEFKAEKRRISEQDLGVGMFLSEMLLSKEEDRRTKKRWKEGTKLPEVSFEQLQNIFSPNYPRHVIINEESLGGIRLDSARKFEGIDEVCDAICVEIAKRLPRRLDAYRFRQDYASEEIEIEGLGKVRVNLSQTGKNIFTYISSIEADTFRLWNCRQSGRRYLNRHNDIARPQDVEIKPLELKLTLYEDDSGIFITEKGVKYTNSRSIALGRGYSGDSFRDEMYQEGRKREFSYFDEGRDKKFASIKPDKCWSVERDRIVEWLKGDVLEKIVATPKYENQATELPEAVAYPDKVGQLYTWISAKKAEKLEVTGGDSSKVYPDEKYALSPEWRLVPRSIRGDFPKEADDGYIWCGIGEAKPNTPSEDYDIPGYHMDNDFGDYRNKLVQVTPKNGEDIFVVDYQVWDDFREKAFKTIDRLSDEEYAEMHRLLARTLIPINGYKGDYKKPVVLIGRDLELDEVKIVPGVEYNPRV